MTTNFTRALTREPGSSVGDGLTTAGLGPPDLERCRVEHAAYVAALRRVGVTVTVLPADEAHPDGWFVEDVAVVTPDLAVITRPGAPSRRGERDAIAAELQKAHLPLKRLEDPTTLDGGDVLIVGKRCFVGLSERTDEAGARALAALLDRAGIRTTRISLTDGLHLKSDVNVLDDGTLVASRALAAHAAFSDFHVIEVPDEERYAANVLTVNGHVLVPEGFPLTADRIVGAGHTVIPLPMREVRRMDGGLTCLSLRY